MIQVIGGAIVGDYCFSLRIYQRYSATYGNISIPGGTTENPDSKWSRDFFVSHRNTKVSEYIITGIPKEPDTNWNFALKMAINMPELPIVSQQTSGR